ncbi:S8 family serine peptidase [Psittacicella gerlachiana]|uniref:Autotransporter domain-containing protein n=1 Tax=Psittacicella gerlachiana TaxID=2028574 RepID=A0A3A1YCR2_9GAMM|nr:S8 family serine peptidase [Psittacicella gerlachiana]RIY35009.1 hypothetical protein CKF59_04320 [Psittacicella gerlachiana]
MKEHKLNRLNASIIAILSATALSACGGGGGSSGSSSYTSSSSTSSSTPISLTDYNTSLATNTTTGNASNDQNTTVANYAYTNSSAQTAANTAFNSSQTANVNGFTLSHTGYTTQAFSNWPNVSVTVNGTATNRAINYNNLFAMGFLPLVSGGTSAVNFYVPVTQNSTSTMNATATLGQGSGYFTGSNVSVGMVDGSFNASWSGFTSSNLTEVKITNQTNGSGGTTILGSSNDHGTKVGAIMAAQRSSTYSGLTPNVKLYYNVLNKYSANNLLGDIYKAMYVYKPAVINNSYYIPYTTSSSSSTSSAESYKGQIQATAYENALAGLKTVTANADTPLFVFTTGNEDDYVSWLKTQDYNTSNWSNVNFGPALDTNSSLYNFVTADTNISDNLLAVTSYSLDINGEYSAVINATKNSISNGSLNTTANGTTEISPELFIMGYEGNTTNASVAVQCGVLKWSCLASSWSWSIANYSNGNYTGFSGTSASAPIVSAAAAMVKEQFDWMTAKQIKTTLLTTAYDVGDTGVDSVFGWGILDASLALNGPAAFVFGDFVANISGTGKRYWFNNNITGSGGLIVNGTSTSDQLVLTGSNNTYTGDTIVNGGALVLQDKKSAGLNATNEAYVSLGGSHVYVNSNGSFYTYNARIANLTNNGYTQVYNTTVTGNFVNKENATLATNLTTVFNVNGSVTLDGTLAILGTSTYVSTGNMTQVKVINATNISGSFDKIYSDYDGSATVNYTVGQASDGVYVNITATNTSTYLTSTSLTSSDSQAASVGASLVDSLLTSANNAVLENSTSSGLISLTASTTETSTTEESSVSVTGETNGLSLTSSYYASVEGDNVVLASQASETSQPTAQTQTTEVSLTATDDESSSESTATSSDTTLTSAAIAIQSLSAEELNALLLRASGTVYSNLLQATSQQARTNILDFTQVSLGRFAGLDQQWHAYVQAGYRWQDWKSKATSVKGHLDSNSYTVGAYTQTANGYNLGFAVQSLNGNWDEGNTNNDITAAFAKVKSYGFSASFGKALATTYYGASVYANFHDFDVTRSVISYADQKAKFRTQSFGLDVKAGWLALGNFNTGLIVEGGLTTEFNHQNAFNETAANSATSLLSLNTKSRWTTQLYANAGVRAYANFRVFGLSSTLDAGLSLNSKLAGQDFKLKLASGGTSGQVFNNDFLARLNLGYAVNVTENLRIRLAGNLEKSSTWTEKSVKLGLDYKF